MHKNLIMRTRNLIVMLALSIGGCHHEQSKAVATAPRAESAAPQPDFQQHKPKAMAARIPASNGHHQIEPTGWVFFETDSDALSAAATQDLDAVVEWLRAHPREQIIVQGNTDASGPADYNLTLSLRRGAVVADYLVSQGVSRARISIDPRGESRAGEQVRSGDRRAIIYATQPPAK